MTSTNARERRKEDHPGAVGAGAHPGIPGAPRTTRTKEKQTSGRKTDSSTISNLTSDHLND